MASQTTPSTAGPALFHRTQARYRQLIADATAAAAATAAATSHISDHYHACDVGDEVLLSDDGSCSDSQAEEDSASAPASEDGIEYVSATRRKGHDPTFVPRPEHTPTPAAVTTTTTPLATREKHRLRRQPSLPQCLRLRPNGARVRADQKATTRAKDVQNLENMGRSLNAGVHRLDDLQHELDAQVARMSRTLHQHIGEDQAFREALNAREVAAAQERVALADRRVVFERMKEEAGRVDERVVAEVVPRAAAGRAHCDLVEARRFAAPRAVRSMVADSSYPRFG